MSTFEPCTQVRIWPESIKLQSGLLPRLKQIQWRQAHVEANAEKVAICIAAVHSQSKIQIH